LTGDKAQRVEGHAWISRLVDQRATRRERGSDEQAPRTAAVGFAGGAGGRSDADSILAQPRRRRPCKPDPCRRHAPCDSVIKRRLCIIQCAKYVRQQAAHRGCMACTNEMTSGITLVGCLQARGGIDCLRAHRPSALPEWAAREGPPKLSPAIREGRRDEDGALRIAGGWGRGERRAR
jgi:hypothetical protein